MAFIAGCSCIDIHKQYQLYVFRCDCTHACHLGFRASAGAVASARQLSRSSRGMLKCAFGHALSKAVVNSPPQLIFQAPTFFSKHLNLIVGFTLLHGVLSRRLSGMSSSSTLGCACKPNWVPAVECYLSSEYRLDGGWEGMWSLHGRRCRICKWLCVCAAAVSVLDHARAQASKLAIARWGLTGSKAAIYWQ